MSYFQNHLNLHKREKRICSACGKEQSVTRHQKGKDLICRFCKAPLSPPKEQSVSEFPRSRHRSRPEIP